MLTASRALDKTNNHKQRPVWGSQGVPNEPFSLLEAIEKRKQRWVAATCGVTQEKLPYVEHILYVNTASDLDPSLQTIPAWLISCGEIRELCTNFHWLPLLGLMIAFVFWMQMQKKEGCIHSQSLTESETLQFRNYKKKKKKRQPRGLQQDNVSLLFMCLFIFCQKRSITLEAI